MNSKPVDFSTINRSSHNKIVNGFKHKIISINGTSESLSVSSNFQLVKESSTNNLNKSYFNKSYSNRCIQKGL